MKQDINKPSILSTLSSYEKAVLLKELALQQQNEEQKKREERQQYKEMVDKEITICFPVLQEVSKAISAAKKYVYDNLSTLTDLKAELYDRKDDQCTHSFTNANGTVTIIIGHNILDGWDDTVQVGIGKVKDFLQTLVKDDDSKNLVDTIMKLIAKDAKGNLKASRVLQLRNFAQKVNNKDFNEAIKIIQDAYRPVRTKEFIRCIFKNEKGEPIALPLSITDAPFPEATVETPDEPILLTDKQDSSK